MTILKHYHRTTLIFACCVLNVASACGGGTDVAPTADAVATCKAQVTDWFAQLSECFVIDQAEIDAALVQCEMVGSDMGVRAFWRPEFGARFDACTATLTCEQLNDAGDFCFPVALEAGASGLLSAETIAACIVSDSTADCEIALAQNSEPNTNPIAACFRRWSECAPERVNSDPYWTEDHCGTLLALKDEYRDQANACLELPCAIVSGCLVEAGSFNF